MERKEIYILIAACLVVCALVGCVNMLRNSAAEEASSTPDTSGVESTEATVSTDYWDYLRAQTETTAVQTDENGNPVEAETDENGNPVTTEAAENSDPEAEGSDAANTDTEDQPAETDETGIFSSANSGEAGGTTTAATTVTTGTTVSTTPFVLHITG